MRLPFHFEIYNNVLSSLDCEFVLQVLLRRFGSVKNKLQLNTGSEDLSAFTEHQTVCCAFTPVFKGWQDVFPPVDHTSLLCDMKLLQELSSVPLDDFDGLRRVILTTYVF